MACAWALAMAGLYELWRDATRERDDPDAWLLTVTVLTTNATDELGQIHDRAPSWLRRVACPTRRGRRQATQPADPATIAMNADPVSTTVNNVRNQAPSLIKRLSGA